MDSDILLDAEHSFVFFFFFSVLPTTKMPTRTDNTDTNTTNDAQHHTTNEPNKQKGSTNNDE
jgi:hypothetical protein